MFVMASSRGALEDVVVQRDRTLDMEATKAGEALVWKDTDTFSVTLLRGSTQIVLEEAEFRTLAAMVPRALELLERRETGTVKP